MDFTQAGRVIVAAVALLVIGFALGSIARITLTNESALAILAGAATMLLLSARRARNDS